MHKVTDKGKDVAHLRLDNHDEFILVSRGRDRQVTWVIESDNVDGLLADFLHERTLLRLMKGKA